MDGIEIWAQSAGAGEGAGACHNNRYVSTEFRGPGIEAERPPRNTEHSWSVQWTSAGATARRAVQAASSRAVQRYRAYSLKSFTFFLNVWLQRFWYTRVPEVGLRVLFDWVFVSLTPSSKTFRPNSCFLLTFSSCVQTTISDELFFF